MTAAELSRYRGEIEASAEASRRYVLRRLSEEGAGLDVAGRRELAIEVIQDATGVFGDRAQATAAELFDEVMEADGVDARAQMFDGLIDHGRTEGSMHYAARKLVDGDRAGFDGDASDLAAYYVHRSAWFNMVNNCDLNHVRWARVPTGEETCEHCLMLASRGFAYHTQASASHKHTGCDCVVVPGNKGSTIEGYDPEECEQRWKSFSHLNRFLGSDEGRAFMREAGLAYGDTRDALARARGVYLTGRDSVRSFLTDLVRGKGGNAGRLPVDRLHPERVAGVPRTKVRMTFGEADGRRANPWYEVGETGETNCAACAAANEVRIRGYDVVARRFPIGDKDVSSIEKRAMRSLAEEPYIAFMDSKTGLLPSPIRLMDDELPTPANFYKMLEDTIGDGERYILRFTNSAADNTGHVVCIDRNAHGRLRILDPQCGSVYEGKAVRKYLERVRFVRPSDDGMVESNNYLFRVDNAEMNLKVLDIVLGAA